jgi:hydrogenase maturation protease
MSPRILVAGVGNIFLSDDAFGVEVARRLSLEPWPDGVRVADFGISSVHLSFELLEGYDELVLIDAIGRGEPPGTLYVIEPDLADLPDDALIDAHSVTPEAVLSLVASAPAAPKRVHVVGCEPASTDEGIGLSPPVAAAVEDAVRLVRDLVADRAARVEA